MPFPWNPAYVAEQARLRTPPPFCGNPFHSIYITGKLGRNIMQTIELDAPPLAPDDALSLYDSLIKETGLSWRDPAERGGTCYAWDYSDIPSDVWRVAQQIIAPRIRDLFNAGAIRYGSW